MYEATANTPGLALARPGVEVESRAQGQVGAREPRATGTWGRKGQGQGDGGNGVAGGRDGGRLGGESKARGKCSLLGLP